ncbi:MAG: hypothetical protein K6T65_07935 [Peptococcaceae bacterium]|nr:hypothetical protein [Peptococcaceae bacterium]
MILVQLNGFARVINGQKKEKEQVYPEEAPPKQKDNKATTKILDQYSSKEAEETIKLMSINAIYGQIVSRSWVEE